MHYSFLISIVSKSITWFFLVISIVRNISFFPLRNKSFFIQFSFIFIHFSLICHSCFIHFSFICHTWFLIRFRSGESTAPPRILFSVFRQTPAQPGSLASNLERSLAVWALGQRPMAGLQCAPRLPRRFEAASKAVLRLPQGSLKAVSRQS